MNISCLQKLTKCFNRPSEEADVPRTSHQVAIVECDEENSSKELKVLKEADKYFDKIVAVEAKDLKFFFEKEQAKKDEDPMSLIYCYFMQVCPHQQDWSQLGDKIGKNQDQLKTILDPELPPRMEQNVHGYFQLGSQRQKLLEIDTNQNMLPSRVDLCNNWDKDTVSSTVFMTKDGPKEGEFVFFYAVQCGNNANEVKAIEINPKPKAIRASYDIGKPY